MLKNRVSAGAAHVLYIGKITLVRLHLVARNRAIADVIVTAKRNTR